MKSLESLDTVLARIEEMRDAAPEFVDEEPTPTPEELWQTRLARCAVPRRFRGVPFSNKPLSFNGWSFVLHGPVGNGKTYQAVSILGHSIGSGLFVDCAVAVELMKQEFHTEGPRLVERMIEVKTLLLDDFGAERLDSEFARDAFATVIRARYNEERRTIITTNLEPEGDVAPTLKDLHPPLYSRLREGTIVRLKGRDRRST